MAESWSKESNTKASSNGSTQDTGFVLDSLKSFIVQNSSLAEIFKIDSSTGGNISFGETTDGNDRIIKFGHGTLESCIGIDDSQDVFAINTDASFEDNNDFEINALGEIYLKTGTIRGGLLTFESQTDMVFQIDSDNNGTETFQFKNGEGTEIAELSESGNLQIDGDLTVSGNNISSLDGSVFEFNVSNCTLAGDFAISGGDLVFQDFADSNRITLTGGGNQLKMETSSTQYNQIFKIKAIHTGADDYVGDSGLDPYGDARDVGVVFQCQDSGNNVIWSNQIDMSSHGKLGTDELVWDYGTETAGGATRMKLSKHGCIIATKHLCVSGGKIGSAWSGGAADDDVSGDVSMAASLTVPANLTVSGNLSGAYGEFTQQVTIEEPITNNTSCLALKNQASDRDPQTWSGITGFTTESGDAAVLATVAEAQKSVLLLVQEEGTINYNLTYATREADNDVTISEISYHDIRSAGNSSGGSTIRYTDTTNGMSEKTYKFIQLGGDTFIWGVSSA